MRARNLLLGAVAVVMLVAGANWALVDLPVSTALSKDSRNSGISMRTYHRWGVDPGTLVVDLWGLPTSVSMADVDRALFTAADALKDRKFGKVVLAWRGGARYVMDGDYFNTIGREYAYQNPVYTVRTMQEYLRTPDGSRAFGTWTGGMLGVLGKQMEDHKEFHRGWYAASAFSL